jgi:NADP-dependent aldehyde dehydrogenase
LDPEFFSAQAEDVDSAVSLGESAFDEYRNCRGEVKGRFLRTIAQNIEGNESEIVKRASLETALPAARLKSETARTAGQLRLFAQLVEEGSWVMARIDTGDPARTPIPRPDIRSMLRPLGPIAVFGASNFPLAFSVAGGDTASALAAGNPVVVKAHPAHPGTSEMVGRAVRSAVAECGLPEGVFSLLFDAGTEIGAALVRHPGIRAGAFTGSRSGGGALMHIAAARPQPIPFYAEMSSTNPMFILPRALRSRPEQIASGMYASFTQGAGQFCTKPGLVFLPEGEGEEQFIEKLKELMASSTEFCLLTSAIRGAYLDGLDLRSRRADVRLKLQSRSDRGDVFAAVFETSAEAFLQDDSLATELFGPSTLLVRYSGAFQAAALARALEGQLTATIHGTDDDLREYESLVRDLETKAGRLIFNGFPTGVEVSHAIVHGGPFPATSDGQSTSVGTRAIYRFCRPVCYQGFSNSALPDELKNENSKGIWRLINGSMSREPLQS